MRPGIAVAGLRPKFPDFDVFEPDSQFVPRVKLQGKMAPPADAAGAMGGVVQHARAVPVGPDDPVDDGLYSGPATNKGEIVPTLAFVGVGETKTCRFESRIHGRVLEPRRNPTPLLAGFVVDQACAPGPLWWRVDVNLRSVQPAPAGGCIKPAAELHPAVAGRLAIRLESEIVGTHPVTRVQSPAETVYFADNESGSWRPVFTIANIQGSAFLNDVWSPGHLPYGASGRTLSGERRVAARRHGEGSNLMYFDGHAGWKAGRRMVLDDWREQK